MTGEKDENKENAPSKVGGITQWAEGEKELF